MLTTEEAVVQQAEDFISNALNHTGVKGMKWGKRKGVTTNSSTDRRPVVG